MTFDTLGITVHPMAVTGIGFLAGTLASLFGIGGGILVTPFLNILGAPMAVAVPTSITYIAGTATLTTVRNRKWGNVSAKAGALIAVFMLPSIEASTHVMRYLRRFDAVTIDTVIRSGFIAFLILTTIAILRKKEGGSPGVLGSVRMPPLIRLVGDRECSLVVLAVGGILAGLIAGMLGLGGGRVLVPIFLLVVGLDTKIAIGTSSFVIMLSSVYGASSYGLKGMVDYPAAGLLLAGSLIGALVGSTALNRFEPRTVKRLYGVLTAAALCGLLLKQFGSGIAALVVLAGTATLIAAVSLGVVWLGRKTPATDAGT